jgi:hypothetical protein
MSPIELRPFIFAEPGLSATLFVPFRRRPLSAAGGCPSFCLLSSCLSSRLFQVSAPLFSLSLFFRRTVAVPASASVWEELYRAEARTDLYYSCTIE